MNYGATVDGPRPPGQIFLSTIASPRLVCMMRPWRKRKAQLASGYSSCDSAIEEHNRRYYEEAAPTISDREYDKLFRELSDLEKRLSATRRAPIPRPNASAANR